MGHPRFLQLLTRLTLRVRINTLHTRALSHRFPALSGSWIQLRNIHRAVSVTHTEMSGWQLQRVAGEDVSRPRSGAARQNDGIDSLAAIIRDLCSDQRRV